MILKVVRCSLILLTVIASFLAVQVLLSPPMKIVLPAPQSSAGSAVGGGSKQLYMASAEELAARSPFRADRRASRTEFRPERVVEPQVPVVTASPKPLLHVSGVVSGEQPAAIVEGIPGAEGSVVLRLGDAAAGIEATSIGRDTVVLAGLDTIWKLEVRVPW